MAANKNWLIVHLDRRLKGALYRMASEDCRTEAEQMTWLARCEAERRGLLAAGRATDRLVDEGVDNGRRN